MANSYCFGQYVPGALGYHEQALMFSKYNYTGSARIQGIGNTQISLGGDISSALSNPAGLGFYNRSEVSITPSYNSFASKSDYFGNSFTTTTGKFNIDNLGAVFNKTKEDIIPGKWRGGSFAITFSKVNEFNSAIQYGGSNPNNDIIDFYVRDSNNQNVDPNQLTSITYGAYDTYLMREFVDVFVNGNDTTLVPFYERNFFSEFPSGDFPTGQSELISTTGSQNQWSFSYGGNFGDFLYFGATLGLQSLRYEVDKQYSELYPNLDGDIVLSHNLYENLITEGFGVNGTFGLIARPISQMTIGFSLITPTYITIDERYTYISEASFDNFNMTNYGDYFDANYDLIVNPDADFTTFFFSSDVLNTRTFNEEFLFDYTITTPLRLNAGASFFINKSGFLSADIEYVDYSSMKLKASDGSLQGDNDLITELYKSTVNVRVGGEWRLDKFRVRAGYNYQPSPYVDSNADRKTTAFSGGLGYRSGKFFSDLAVTYTQFSGSYAPYVIDNPDDIEIYRTTFVELNNTNLNFALTLGLFF